MDKPKDERMFQVNRKQAGITDLSEEQVGVYELSDEQLALVHGSGGINLNLNPMYLIVLPKNKGGLP